MSRFNRKFRNKQPGRVCNHFDKYAQFINPVPFDAFRDIYRRYWPDEEWNALKTLMGSKFARKHVQRNGTFKVYVSDDSNLSEWQRDYVQFSFPAGEKYPNCDVELLEMPKAVIDQVRPWVSKGLALQKLRHELYKRVEQLLDWGWEENKYYSSGAWNHSGGWRGGPTSGQGCNTIGQVNRIWPELVIYFPAEDISAARNANQKSRLPTYIRGHGTPGMFTCEERPHHSVWYEENDDGKYEVEFEDPYTDEQWLFAKRRFAALNHILVQMSLIKDVGHVQGYPEISVKGQ